MLTAVRASERKIEVKSIHSSFPPAIAVKRNLLAFDVVDDKFKDKLKSPVQELKDELDDELDDELCPGVEGKAEDKCEDKSVGSLEINPSDTRIDLTWALRAHFSNALFLACLATITSIYEIEELPELTGEQDSIYVRDPVVLIHDKKLILYSKRDDSFHDYLISALKYLDYSVHFLANCFLDGGNCHYFSPKKIFLLGIVPNEDYGNTKKVLSTLLKKHDIKFVDIKVQSMPGNVAINYYYHIDCYMQILPDGRVLILNKDIITPDSYRKLQQIFGATNVIDLAYLEYKNPKFMFNFIVGDSSPNYTLLCPTMPMEIILKLRTLGLKVITPASISYGDKEYDKDLAKKVVEILRKKGFLTATPENLACHLAQNALGYKSTAGIVYKPDLYRLALTPDKVYRDRKPTFCPQDGGPMSGGPHCITLDLPSRPASKKIFASSPVFFSATTPAALVGTSPVAKETPGCCITS